MKKLTALIILDGFGCSKNAYGNAIVADGVSNISNLWNKYPHTTIAASGEDVGLPEGQMGNSEVGHLNIGAGRVVYQELTRITKSIKDGDFFTNPAFIAAIDNCKAHDSSLHIMGLCSDGGVHSAEKHLFALLKLAHINGIERVYVHCFMDGRDVPPDSGLSYVKRLIAETERVGCGSIATVMGRYYAMDRDNRYERVEKAYAALVCGEGAVSDDPIHAVEASYQKGVTDEFIVPTVITNASGKPVATVQPNDSIVFYNFRPDRARELTRAFIYPEFDGFNRKNGYFPVEYVCMTQYDKSFGNLVKVAFTPQALSATLGEYIASLGKKQLRIAETEKYAHVTFFFNGGVEAPNVGEDRVLIPSPKVATYDMTPEMSAYSVAEKAVDLINGGEYDLMILNFANPDMVGHTGVMEAAVAAVHAVDKCVAKVVGAILENGGQCLITADHGNCENMMYDDGSPMTAHTTNPVPLIYAGEDANGYALSDGGRLCDIAPTLLALMGLPKPVEMSGKSLLIPKGDQI